MNKTARQTILFTVVVLIACPAMAFRCGSNLIEEGDAADRVRHYCGDPTSISHSVVYRPGPQWLRSRDLTRDIDRGQPLDDELAMAGRSVVEVQVEDWTYNFGPNRLMERVRLENGVVAGFEWLGYGYQDN